MTCWFAMAAPESFASFEGSRGRSRDLNARKLHTQTQASKILCRPLKRRARAVNRAWSSRPSSTRICTSEERGKQREIARAATAILRSNCFLETSVSDCSMHSTLHPLNSPALTAGTKSKNRSKGSATPQFACSLTASSSTPGTAVVGPGQLPESTPGLGGGGGEFSSALKNSGH